MIDLISPPLHEMRRGNAIIISMRRAVIFPPKSGGCWMFWLLGLVALVGLLAFIVFVAFIGPVKIRFAVAITNFTG